MKKLEGGMPLLAALISAGVILFGYVYQKNMEREAEVRKARQEIYVRLINNITQRMALLDRFAQRPGWKSTLSDQEKYELALGIPGMRKNLAEQKNVGALLLMFGTDEGIREYANWLRGDGRDLGRLMLSLRKSIYPETRALREDANQVIWNELPSQARASKK
jgi:hypothetical protein